jgi:hypothetical protein
MTLTAPYLPDGEVESFVRVLQMRHGTGLSAYRTESCVEGGFSFLIIEMLTSSVSLERQTEVRVYAVSYPLAASIEGFCELGYREGRAALKFDPHEYGTVLWEVAQWFERRCGADSGAARAARGLALVCGNCCGAFSGMRFRALANATGQVGQHVPCERCGSSQVLALYRFVDPKSITKQDLADIRAYLRERGRAWWTSHPQASAVCDGCNKFLSRSEGWLSGSWLLCEACAARSFNDAVLDDLKRNPNHFGDGVLDMARQAAGRPSDLERKGSSSRSPTSFRES